MQSVGNFSKKFFRSFSPNSFFFNIFPCKKKNKILIIIQFLRKKFFGSEKKPKDANLSKNQSSIRSEIKTKSGRKRGC